MSAACGPLARRGRFEICDFGPRRQKGHEKPESLRVTFDSLVGDRSRRLTVDCQLWTVDSAVIDRRYEGGDVKSPPTLGPPARFRCHCRFHCRSRARASRLSNRTGRRTVSRSSRGSRGRSCRCRRDWPTPTRQTVRRRALGMYTQCSLGEASRVTGWRSVRGGC